MFSVSEKALFYNAWPNRTMAIESELCYGGKKYDWLQQSVTTQKGVKSYDYLSWTSLKNHTAWQTMTNVQNKVKKGI